MATTDCTADLHVTLSDSRGGPGAKTILVRTLKTLFFIFNKVYRWSSTANLWRPHQRVCVVGHRLNLHVLLKVRPNRYDAWWKKPEVIVFQDEEAFVVTERSMSYLMFLPSLHQQSIPVCLFLTPRTGCHCSVSHQISHLWSSDPHIFHPRT